MAFVAPITPFDQIQYANRTALANQKKKDIQGVNAIPSAHLYAKEEDLWENYVKRQWPHLPNYRGSRYKNRPDKEKKPLHSHTGEEAEAQITGKGQNFNESI